MVDTGCQRGQATATTPLGNADGKVGVLLNELGIIIYLCCAEMMRSLSCRLAGLLTEITDAS